MEFSVVLLAGGAGSRLHPLVRDGGRPKALLPVCNRPLIFYQLYMLEQAGFEDVIAVVSSSSSAAITNYLMELYGQDPLVVECRSHQNRKPMMIRVKSMEDGQGTADVLRNVMPMVEGEHVVVMSGDVVTNVSLNELADTHRISDADVTLFLREEDPTALASTDPFDFVGISGTRKSSLGSLSEVVLFEASVDVDDSLAVPRSLLRHSPDLSIRTDLFDAHIYVISRSVLAVLQGQPSISSIKYQLIPFLIRNQFKLASDKYRSRWKLRPRRSSILGGLDRPRDDRVLCFAACSSKGTYARRVNTAASFQEVNREVASGVISQVPVSSTTPRECGEKSNISPDTVVGVGVRLGSRTSLKKAIVGDHCTIGSNVKITSSVIMDHVTIADGSNIQGSVVCENADIRNGCTLRDCHIGESVTIAEGTDAKNEQFTKDQETNDLFI